MEYRGLEIDKLVQGFRHASLLGVIRLKKYIKERQESEPVKYTQIYADILLKIDSLFPDLE